MPATIQVKSNGDAKNISEFHGHCAQILSGLFKKLVVSSYLSIEIVDKVFAVPQNYNLSII